MVFETIKKTWNKFTLDQIKNVCVCVIFVANFQLLRSSVQSAELLAKVHFGFDPNVCAARLKLLPLDVFRSRLYAEQAERQCIHSRDRIRYVLGPNTIMVRVGEKMEKERKQARERRPGARGYYT